MYTHRRQAFLNAQIHFGEIKSTKKPSYRGQGKSRSFQKFKSLKLFEAHLLIVLKHLRIYIYTYILVYILVLVCVRVIYINTGGPRQFNKLENWCIISNCSLSGLSLPVTLLYLSIALCFSSISYFILVAVSDSCKHLLYNVSYFISADISCF